MAWKDIADNPWYRGGEIPIGARKQIEHGEWVLHHFPKLGVDLNPSGRIHKSLELIRNIQHQQRPLPGDYIAIEAGRTIHEFYFIGRTLLAYPTFYGEKVLNKLVAAVGGNLVEADDRIHRPRNTQLELFQYCVFIQAALYPSLEEPDIVFQFMSKRYGCAVKRMRTENDDQTKKRFRSAVHQLERYSIPGFVCLDVDIRLRDLREPVADFNAAERGAEFDSEIEHLYSLHTRELNNPSYLGLFVVGFARSDEPAGSKVHSGAYYQKLVLFSEMFRDDDERLSFERAMRRGYGTFLNFGAT